MKRILGLATALLLSAAAPVVQASPYASSLTNSAGVISFRLNESADSVKIISNGGAVTNDLGARPAGLTVTNVGVSGVYQVVVFKNGAPGYTQGAANQISVDANSLLRFPVPRGVVVNRDPASPYFGRIYAGNSTPGTTTTTGVSRTAGRGIYALNADQTDALGFGNTAKTAGIAFAASAASPYRLELGRDGILYIADWSDANGSIYFMNGDLTTSSFGSQLLAGVGAAAAVGPTLNHGSVAAVVINGTLTNGDITAFWVDEDLQVDRNTAAKTQVNSLWRLDIGGNIPATNVATKIQTPGINFTSQTMDAAQGPDGKLYLVQYRSAGAEPIVSINLPDGTVVTNTLLMSRAFLGNPAANDLMAAGQCVDISPDGRFMAVVKDNAQTIIAPLSDGIPDIANFLVVNTSGGTSGGTNSVAFDAANNLYVLGGNQTMRIFSPGGPTTATTTSDGAFTYTNVLPQTAISVTATKRDAYETNPTQNNAVFRLTRTGDVSQQMTATYTLGGTAINGTDYVTIPLSVTFLAGETTTNVTIVPIDDAIAEAPETVILTLLGGTNYSRVAPITDTISISDNETPAISVTATDVNMYERVMADIGKYTFKRLGETNVAVTVNLTFSGTAVNGTDFTDRFAAGLAPTSVTFPVGVTSVDYFIAPVDNALLQGTKTATVTVAAGTGYTPIAPLSANVVITDDEVPVRPILFQDNFDTDTSANWTVLYGSSSNVVANDYIAKFNYDYVAGDPLDPNDFAANLPPAPGSTNLSSPRGLKLTANKNNGFAAGVNVYAKNQNFSGNYALRYNLFMLSGGISTTEYALGGINHSGTKTNFTTQGTDFNGSTAGGDGIWFAIESDASNNRDYAAYTSTNSATGRPFLISTKTAAAMVPFLSNPPYTVGQGSPGIDALGDYANFTWVDVEIAQQGLVVTLKINNQTVMSVTNVGVNYAYTNGTIMLGYNDQFDSLGGSDNFAAYDNVRVVSLNPVVWVTASDPNASEPSSGVVNNGAFTFSRSGDTNADLVVNYTLSGGATVGVDYNSISTTSVTIPAGSLTATLAIVPKADAVTETNETVIITLLGNASYDTNILNGPITATVTITNVPAITVSASDPTAAEPGAVLNPGVFTFTRTNDLSFPLVVSYNITGTAQNGVDYVTIPSTITFATGATTTNLTITPLSDNLIESSETVIVTLVASANYDIGAANSATVTIADTPPVAPKFITPLLTATNFQFILNGGLGDSTNQFSIQRATNVTGPYLTDTNALVLFLSNGAFRVTATNNPGTNQFFRIIR